MANVVRTSRTPVRGEHHAGGAVLRLLLDAPPGNILDTVMIGALRAALAAAVPAPGLKAIVIEGAGAHFSYGASIEEHRPRAIAGLLQAFHGLLGDLAAAERVLLAVVRGQCLGGGMELACFCQRVFASPEARLAQPEIRLAVIPPAASLILPRRAGQAAADEACLTGRAFTAAEAREMRFIDAVAQDPWQAAREWLDEQILPRSAAALRHAVRAARLEWNRAVLEGLRETGRLYLDGLMRTADAVEGIEAFLAKRAPVWQDR
jgi:cyclohexa-1,5-dienecarbonyl-CoA hydratase